MSQSLSGSHAFTHCLSLSYSLSLYVVTAAMYLRYVLYYMGQYLPISPPVPFFWTLVIQRSGVISCCVSFLLKHLHLRYHFLYFFSFSPPFFQASFWVHCDDLLLLKQFASVFVSKLSSVFIQESNCSQLLYIFHQSIVCMHWIKRYTHSLCSRYQLKHSAPL